MRPLKIVMTVLVAVFAVLAGLFIAAAAAITSVVLSFLKRSRGVPASPRTGPVFHTGKGPPKGGDGDVIDVIATEVPADPARR